MVSKNEEFAKGHSPLTEDQRATLDFEATPFKFAGDKEEAIVRTFGHSATRHYQRLNALLDNPAAMEYNPTMINRLRRQRDQRQNDRSAKRLGLDI